MKDFTIETIECAEKNSIDLSIVCTTEESQRYVESLLSNKIRSIKIKVLPFKKDLAKVLHNYDVVAGPSGTTTFLLGLKSSWLSLLKLLLKVMHTLSMKAGARFKLEPSSLLKALVETKRPLLTNLFIFFPLNPACFTSRSF